MPRATFVAFYIVWGIGVGIASSGPTRWANWPICTDAVAMRWFQKPPPASADWALGEWTSWCGGDDGLTAQGEAELLHQWQGFAQLDGEVDCRAALYEMVQRTGFHLFFLEWTQGNRTTIWR